MTILSDLRIVTHWHNLHLFTRSPKEYAWLIHELCPFVEIEDNPGDPLLSARLLRRSMALIGPDQ